MHTYCRLLVQLDSSCEDFMHTNSVLCRRFADLMHTSSRAANGFHSNAPHTVWARWPFLRGLKSSGCALAATTTSSYAPASRAMLRRRRRRRPYWVKWRQWPPPAFDNEAHWSVVHRVPPPPAAGTARLEAASRAGMR